jgi:hypothetical protein
VFTTRQFRNALTAALVLIAFGSVQGCSEIAAPLPHPAFGIEPDDDDPRCILINGAWHCPPGMEPPEDEANRTSG